MLRTRTQLLSHSYYYFLQILGGLIAVLGVACIKGIPILLCVAVIEYLGKEFEWLFFIFGSIVGIAIIGWPVGKLIITGGLKISDYSERYKVGFLRLFGAQYAEPKLGDFGLTEEQYYSYNRRLQLGELGTLLSIGAALGVMYWYGSTHSERGLLPGLTALTLAGGAGLGARLLVYWLDDSIARRYPQHFSVKQYGRAKRIHEAIQTELREKRAKEKFPEPDRSHMTVWQKLRATIWDD